LIIIATCFGPHSLPSSGSSEVCEVYTSTDLVEVLHFFAAAPENGPLPTHSRDF